MGLLFLITIKIYFSPCIDPCVTFSHCSFVLFFCLVLLHCSFGLFLFVVLLCWCYCWWFVMLGILVCHIINVSVSLLHCQWWCWCITLLVVLAVWHVVRVAADVLCCCCWWWWYVVFLILLLVLVHYVVVVLLVLC